MKTGSVLVALVLMAGLAHGQAATSKTSHHNFHQTRLAEVKVAGQDSSLHSSLPATHRVPSAAVSPVKTAAIHRKTHRAHKPSINTTN